MQPSNVDGWSVQYASAAGTSWTNTVDLAGTIAPGGRYLIQLAGGPAATPLPRPTLIGDDPDERHERQGRARHEHHAAVRVRDRTAPRSPQVRDFAGYGTADDFEGTGPIPALDALNAGFRAEGGCQDTRRQRRRLRRAAPAPRNSAAPATPCTGPQPPVAACGGPLRGDRRRHRPTRAVSATDPDGRVTGLALDRRPVPPASR